MTEPICTSRRHFLRAASAGFGAGLILPPWLGNAAFGDKARPDRGAISDKRLIVHQKAPHNAEPELPHLVESWITPVEYFYVRSHAPVPEIDLDTYRLAVAGLVERPLSLSLAQVAEFDPKEVTATMTCAGNRRAEYNAIREVGGVQWAAGAIGNARWKGLPLKALLKMAGVKEGARHVWFEGLDRIDRGGGKTISFDGSIPLDKALATHNGTPGALVTTQMNGRPLAPDHGFPVRMVVPGYIGARSVKWLGRIVVSDRPSPNHYVAEAYKLVTKDTDEAWAAADPLYEFALNAAIAQPEHGAKVKPPEVAVRGYALPPGKPDRAVAKLELSNGKAWHAATFLDQAEPFCWRRWEANIPIAAGTTHLIARATDSAGDAMPVTVPWNLKGYMNNTWYRTPIEVGG